jgi:hypothetical protein
MQAVRDVFILLAVAAAMVWFGWIGFLASDDWMYALAAERWVATGPHLGPEPFSLRHPVVLPIAASFAFFGAGETALVAPSILCFFITLGLTYRWLRFAASRRVAALAGLLLATSPLFAVTATVAGADLTELLLVALSLWLFYTAPQGSAARARLFGAGLAAGLAFSTRETSLFLAAYYGLLFLVGYGVPRRSYALLAAPFVAVAAVELAAFTVLAGDPWYRLRLDLGAQLRTPAEGTGNIELQPFLDPLLVLLLNQEFALFFFVAIPAGLQLCFGRGAAEPARRLGRFWGGFALLWFVAVGFNPMLVNVPRYFSVTVYGAAIVTALWLAELARLRLRSAAAALLALLLLGNLLGVYLENRDPLFGLRRLVDAAAAARETVYTDPETKRRASFLLARAGVAERVSAAPPPRGALYLHDPKRAGTERAPRASWRAVQRWDRGRKHSGRLAQWLGLDRWLPAAIFAKLDHPNPPVVLYRVGDDRRSRGAGARDGG